MHELAIVYSIMKQVEDVCMQNELSRVSRITVDIGEVSSIVPKYLLDFWPWAVNKSQSVVLSNAELIFETIPAITVCNDCMETYPTKKHGKQCPHCQSSNTVLLTGNEFIIREIEAS